MQEIVLVTSVPVAGHSSCRPWWGRCLSGPPSGVFSGPSAERKADITSRISAASWPTRQRASASTRLDTPCQQMQLCKPCVAPGPDQQHFLLLQQPSTSSSRNWLSAAADWQIQQQLQTSQSTVTRRPDWLWYVVTMLLCFACTIPPQACVLCYNMREELTMLLCVAMSLQASGVCCGTTCGRSLCCTSTASHMWCGRQTSPSAMWSTQVLGVRRGEGGGQGPAAGDAVCQHAQASRTASNKLLRLH
jgi:hypothetical protein